MICAVLPYGLLLAVLLQICHHSCRLRHHHYHHHHLNHHNHNYVHLIAIIEQGVLLKHSGPKHPEVSSVVFSAALCLLVCSFYYSRQSVTRHSVYTQCPFCSAGPCCVHTCGHISFLHHICANSLSKFPFCFCHIFHVCCCYSSCVSCFNGPILTAVNNVSYSWTSILLTFSDYCLNCKLLALSYGWKEEMAGLRTRCGSKK